MSEVKVNKISPRSGTTVTLGDSGDTFTIPSGATINNQGTATNFGATGSASWVTTVKTGDFTAVAGEGYFVNTTSGEVDVALPAGTAGAVVAIKDYAGTFDTNKVTLVQNGSDKIGGSALNATLETEGIAVTLVFIDSTQGWLVTDDGLQSVAETNPYMVATGGTITNTPTCRIHTFTGPGTFTVCKIATSAVNNEVSYVVVAGGGAGGGANGGSTGGAGGGGAGGYRETKSPVTPYTASPLDGQPSAPNRITVTATSFPITVGAGAAGVSNLAGNSGSVSTFSTITSAGGGGGGARAPSPSDVGDGLNGGSGGGGSYGASQDGTAGSGNTPPTTPPQGNNGAAYSTFETGSRPGGGGGAGATGFAAGGNCRGGNGGTGTTSSINGTPTARAGGGGGAAGPLPTAGGTGGPGGGANGSSGAASNAGTANTGGGGGARSGACQGSNTTGGAGGSGIVIIRYKIA
jgi:hypothetical protein